MNTAQQTLDQDGGLDPVVYLPAAAEAAAQLEDASAEEVIRWALDRWGEQVVLVTSFQAEGMVILDIAHRIRPNLKVLTLDTGRLHQETYSMMERVRERYGIEVEVYTPQAERLEEMVRKFGPNLFYQSVDLRLLCCQRRKVEPLRRALAGRQAWFTGLRRDQAASRAHTAKVEADSRHRGLFKVSPLADWSEEQVWTYIRENRVPYHPLYDQGYTSIGCAPCTRRTQAGEDPRAGRWWWEDSDSKKECGLHVKTAERERLPVLQSVG